MTPEEETAVRRGRADLAALFLAAVDDPQAAEQAVGQMGLVEAAYALSSAMGVAKDLVHLGDQCAAQGMVVSPRSILNQLVTACREEDE